MKHPKEVSAPAAYPAPTNAIPMLEKIKNEIRQDYFQQRFSNDGERFVAWYLRNIHAKDMNETRDCITDGADDKQIDAIVVDDEKSTVFVIQGKFIDAPRVDAVPLREVLSSWIQLKDLARLQAVGNNRLKRKLAEVARAFEDDYEVSFELLTTSNLSDGARNDLATFQAQLAKAEDFPATIHLVDQDELRRRYDMALDRENPIISHSMQLESGKYLAMKVGGTQAIIAAIQVKDCLNIPGIKDGTLFQKNVRASLGLSNAVNKGIKATLYGDKHRDFFFFHNGVTAIANKLTLREDGYVDLAGLSVVNGCQSLNTILSCSERAKEIDQTYIMFRFYEIPQRDRADKISISTNSQSAVKPRDLRSNDKRVLSLKKSYELAFPHGYFVTKRGEQAPADRDAAFVLDLSDFAKYLVTWHSQRPILAYSEMRLFDKYFEQLFRRPDEYSPKNAQALNSWMAEIQRSWGKDNPLSLNESLLAMRSIAVYHHLYAASIVFAILNNQPDRVAAPAKAFEAARTNGLLGQVVEMAGTSLNTALETAANEPQPNNRVFSPQNWIKTKGCLTGINTAVRQYLSMLPSFPGGKETNKRLREALTLDKADFEYRWAAD